MVQEPWKFDGMVCLFLGYVCRLPERWPAELHKPCFACALWEGMLPRTTFDISPGGWQLPTAAITNSQHGGRRSRYKIIFTVRAIIKHLFMV